MDNDRENTEQVLDDSQRIELLEKARKLDRLLLLALGGVLLAILASWVTYAVLVLSAEEDVASSASVAALQQQVTALDGQLVTLKEQLAAAQQSQQAQAPTTLAAGGTDDPTVVRQVARTLIGQERNFQQTLAALKRGMQDLAGMIPGSRSWLSFYQEALDAPLGESRARSKNLEQWAGQLPVADDAKAAADDSATPAAPAAPVPEKPAAKAP